MGNPFLGDSQELMTLDSHNCVDKDVADTLYTMEAQGKEQYTAYVKDVLVERTVSVHKPIKRNRLLIFKQLQAKSKSKTKQQMDDIENDCSPFSRLFISSQIARRNINCARAIGFYIKETCSDPSSSLMRIIQHNRHEQFVHRCSEKCRGNPLLLDIFQQKSFFQEAVKKL